MVKKMSDIKVRVKKRHDFGIRTNNPILKAIKKFITKKKEVKLS